MKINIKFFLFIIMLLATAGILKAQDAAEDLSKQAANPIADLMSFPFQKNLNINFGSEWQWRFPLQILLPKTIFSKKNNS